ncbi:hypothetical protein [Thiobacter aerophilum]|uniref:Uncharacterized protein n=1 Tax=Thiobacter aerophilum TaxID=3121275 RepID=A0ABV0EI74_9BURK
MSVECYGQRLLNPFRGAMHTIRYEAAEAVTLDGVHWDIYVANDSLLEGLDASCHPQITDIRFGAWSVERGLKRGPIYPSEDFLRMEEMGAIVYQYLTQVHRRVPFPFRDRHEFWLLDEAHQPLALLHSVVEPGDMNLDVELEWRPGFLARERFRSDALAGAGDSAAEHLARHVNARAGAHPAGQWFRREADGSGTGLAHTDGVGAVAGRRLPPEAFPPLLLAVDWMDGDHRRLAADFQAWQAPWLLALPDLDRALRAELERQARQQATLVERLHRLYPEVVDRKMLNAALVEAILCRNQGEDAPSRDTTLSTFYIELAQQPPDWERGR